MSEMPVSEMNVDDMNNELSIEVVSDIVCPWCYVGKRRLRRAIDLMPGSSIDVQWRPFRLDSTIPTGGIPRQEYLTRKFGSVEAAAPMYEQLTRIGPEEGISFHFDRITRSPNTVNAHRLIKWATADGIADDVVERLFEAYFSEGLDVGDTEVLARLAEEAGFTGKPVNERLDTDEDRDQTVAEIEHATHTGVNGVPCFIIDRRIVVMGAHPPETLVQAMEEALAERDSSNGTDA